MDVTLKSVLWSQFGATIDMFDNARLSNDPSRPPEFSEFSDFRSLQDFGSLGRSGRKSNRKQL